MDLFEEKKTASTFDLTEPNTGFIPVGKPVLENRAVKYHVALGEVSPGLDKVSSLIASPGGEETLREVKASDEMKKRREAAIRIFQEETDKPAEDLSSIVEASGRRVGTDSVLERGYAEKVLDTTLSLGNAEDLNAEYSSSVGMSEEMYTAALERIAHGEVIRKAFEDATAVKDAQGWGSYAGDFAKSMIPLYTWSTQRNDALGEKLSTLLPGSNRQEQYDFINQLSPEDAKAVIKAVQEEMMASNTGEAYEWMRGLYEGYGAQSALDNVFAGLDIASVTPVGLARKLVTKGAAKGASVAIAEAAVPSAGSRINNTIKRTAQAVSEKGATVETVLSATGNVAEAADEAALRYARELVPATTKSLQQEMKHLVDKTPSLSNPEHFFVNASEAYKPRAEAIANLLKKNATVASEQFSKLINVARLPENLERFALEAANVEFDKTMRNAGLANAVLTVKHIPSFKTGMNLSHLDITMGTKSGEFFKSAKVAENTAKGRYNLPEGSFSITQEGNGFAIQIRKDIDETQESILDRLISTENSSNVSRNKILGIIPEPKFLNSYRESVSQFQAEQRGITTHGMNAAAAKFREMSEAYIGLSRKELDGLQRILKINRDSFRVPGDKDTRGLFYNSIQELEDSYTQHLNRLPTDKETAAYFTYRQQSDYDYLLRSTMRLTSKSRLGIKKYEATVGKTTLSFEGKELDKLPFNTRWDGNVAYFNAKGEPKLERLHKAGFSETINKEIKDRGLKIVQVFNPSDQPLKESLNLSGEIHFVVVPKVKSGALNLSEQVSYRPGGHVKYTREEFVKQAQFGYDSAGKRVYFGDSVALGVSNTAKGMKEAKLLDRARLAIKAKDDIELQKVLDEGLPYTVKEMKKAFKERFNVDAPFSVVRSGQKTIDSAAKTVNGKSLIEDVGYLEDMSDSPFNLARQIDSEYIGPRDGALHEIKEGTETNPHFTLEESETLDPLQTQIEALGRLSKEKYFNEYKISSASAFVEEFADLLTVNGRGIQKNELRRNPFHYVTHGELKGSPLDKRYATAKHVQLAIRNLVSHRSMIQNAIDTFQKKLLSSVYEKTGEKYLSKVDTLTSVLKTDFFGKARAMAFHTKQGLFNVAQAPLQIQTWANIQFISPKHGPAASMVSMAHRRMILRDGDTPFLKEFSDKLAKITPGWSGTEIHESYQLLRATGWDLVKGDHSWKDDVSDPKILRGKAGTALDFAAGFFTETERFIRLSAWNTAYKEQVSKMPNLAGKLSDADAKRVLDRAKDLAGLMTRDANAFWQEGPASVATQFWGYSMRMHDLMTGKRLTTGEKTRLIAGWSALYGLPVGLTPLMPFWPLKDELRQRLMEEGVNVNEGVADAILNGLLASTVSAMTGEQLDVGGRWGPDANRALYNLTQTKYGQDALDSIIETMAGASGSILLSIGSDASRVVKDLAYWMGNDEGDYGRVVLADLNRLGKNVSTYSNFEKIVMAHNVGLYQTKEGRVLADDYEVWEGVVHALTGIGRQDVTDSFIMFKSAQDQADFEAKIKKEAKYYIRKYNEALAAGDDDAADQFARAAKAAFVAGNTPPNIVTKVWREVQKEESVKQESQDRFISAPDDPLEKEKREKALMPGDSN